MSSIFTLKASTLAIILVASFVSAICQANHAFMTYEYQVRDRKSAIGVAYETAVAILLVLGMLFVNASYEYFDGFYLLLWSLSVPLTPLLCVNALGAVMAALAAAYLRIPLLVGDACAFACLFPPVMEAAGSIVPLCLYVAWFFARSLYVTWQDARSRRSRPGRHLANEALKNLPEGVILAQANGRILLINDAMRRLLSSLEMTLRLSDANELWLEMAKFSEKTSDGALRVRNGQGRTILFYRLEAESNQQAYRQYWAFDVTESINLSREIEQANEQLAQVANKMEEQLANVEEIARREAVLTMQARMHDVASQRLSILHGMLQLGKTDDASLAELKPLLTSVVDDLSSGQDALSGFGNADENGVSAAADVSGIQPLQHAFSLIGTHIELSGTLPDDDVLRAAFVQVIREAATNAVRHAQATRVQVAIEEREERGSRCLLMQVTNDGKPAANLHEGNGIRGMRRKIERLAGTLDVTCLSPFTLSVVVPCGGDSAVNGSADSVLGNDFWRRGVSDD